MFLYQLRVHGFPKGQSSIVCMCPINWTSSLGCGTKPIVSRRTDSTKMVATKHHCMVESMQGYVPGNSLFRVSLSTHE